MFLLVCSAILAVISYFLIKREKRRFYNAVILFATVASAFLGIAKLSYDKGYIIIHYICLGIVFGVIPLSIILLVAFLFIDTYVLLNREGKTIRNLLPAAFGFALLVMILGTMFVVIKPLDVKQWMIFEYIYVSVGCFLCYLAVMFVSFLSYSFFYSFMPKKATCDYIIIHGSGLLGGNRVSPLLAGRIDKAIDLYHLGGKKAKLIASGGKGEDEIVSEAEAMQKYLLEKSVPYEDIIIEDKSTTTFENIIFSKKIIENRQEGKKYYCLFVTSDYHVLRTSLIAKDANLIGEGVGSKTVWYYWITAFLREYVAIIVRYKWILIAVIAGIIFLLAYSILPF